MACNPVLFIALLLLGVNALFEMSPVYVLNRPAVNGRSIPITEDFAAVVEYYSGAPVKSPKTLELSTIFQLYPFEMFGPASEIALVENLDSFEGLGQPSFYAANVSDVLHSKRAAPNVFDANSPEFSKFLAEKSLETHSNVLVVGIRPGSLDTKNDDFSKKPSPRKSTTPSPFFVTLDDCERQTGLCSGHGRCQKQGNGMYACKCVPGKDASGKTVSFGGNDCSKRDVSWQFNLLVGTSLAIFVAGSMSVSLLFKLGSEPLPGILTTI